MSARTHAPPKAPPAPRPEIRLRTAALQGCGGHPGRGACPERDPEAEGLQRLELSPAPSREAPAVVHEVLATAGRPLEPGARRFGETRLGHDFASVRIHTDARAVESVAAVGARAYTVGRHVVFGHGQYAPATPEGKRVLAHELAHVVQQRAAAPAGRLEIGATDHPAEAEADRVADAAVTAGGPGTPPLPAAGPPGFARTIRRQPPVGGVAAPPIPHYRDCVPPVTGVPNADELLENGRLRAREFVGAAQRVLAAAPAAGTTYATALNRHFIAPTAAQRATIAANYGQILQTLRVGNYICNSQNICGTEQAFWIPDDDLVHVCRPFWPLGILCRAIVLTHEGAHDVGVDAAVAGHPPNRGSAAYPAGNTGPPGGQTTAARMQNPDAYAFFAAHIWRNTDAGATCF